MSVRTQNEKMNLTDLLTDGANGNFSLTFEKASNGVIVHVTHNTQVPNGDQTDANNFSEKIICEGTPEETLEKLVLLDLSNYLEA